MTLIEIMIVIAMIAGVMAMATFVIFPGKDAELREEASKLAGTIRFLYNEAAIKNKYYRIAFNLDENSYNIESSTEPFYVALEDQEGAKKSSLSESSLGKKQEGSEEGALGEAPPEGPEAFAAESGVMIKPRKFDSKLKIKDIFVQHAPDRKEVGIVHAYFLPNGWAEPMIINLSDQDEEVFYSLQINPLTGKSKIRTEYFEVDPSSFRKSDEELGLAP